MNLPTGQKTRYKVIAGALLIAVTFSVFLVKQCGESSKWTLVSGTEEQAISSEEKKEDDEKAEETEREENAAASISAITVDVAGEVKSPSVYILPGGSRVYEAVNAAGGFTASADTRNTNLAACLSDGSKLYIPSRNEVEKEEKETGQTAGTAYIGGNTAATAAIASSGSTTQNGDGSGGLINLNTASSEELQELPGVGPSTAEKILAYRTQYGRFTNKEELMNVSGIGEKTYAKLENLITAE